MSDDHIPPPGPHLRVYQMPGETELRKKLEAWRIEKARQDRNDLVAKLFGFAVLLALTIVGAAGLTS